MARRNTNHLFGQPWVTPRAAYHELRAADSGRPAGILRSRLSPGRSWRASSAVSVAAIGIGFPQQHGAESFAPWRTTFPQC